MTTWKAATPAAAISVRDREGNWVGYDETGARIADSTRDVTITVRDREGNWARYDATGERFAEGGRYENTGPSDDDLNAWDADAPIQIAAALTALTAPVVAKLAPNDCPRCAGTGTYQWGAVVNGRHLYSGTCYRCLGSGSAR